MGPISVVQLGLTPLIILLRNIGLKSLLIRFNRAVTFLYYIPFAVFATALFLALNLAVIPFAYLTALMSKLKLIKL